MIEAAVLGSGGALLVLALHKLIKRLRRSDCVVDNCSGCLSIHIPPELELVKQKIFVKLLGKIEEKQ